MQFNLRNKFSDKAMTSKKCQKKNTAKTNNHLWQTGQRTGQGTSPGQRCQMKFLNFPRLKTKIPYISVGRYYGLLKHYLSSPLEKCIEKI
jgi:hypothetical protein